MPGLPQGGARGGANYGGMVMSQQLKLACISIGIVLAFAIWQHITEGLDK